MLACFVVLACSCQHQQKEGGSESSSYEAIRLPEGAVPPPPSQSDGGDDEYPVPAPPFSEDIFPCSDCHEDMEPNMERRKLDEHDGIVLDHGPRDRWCFDCHNPDDRNQLRLTSGKLVPFTKSYLLCGQCHGPKLRDWRKGVHGKRTGNWDGPRNYLLCAHCHNPHTPKFKPIAPMPPPIRPGDIR